MKKWMEKIPYLIVVVGIIIDLYVNLTGDYLIFATESYMDYLFAGIVTVSVLCFSFVALISSFLEKSYFGYRLREIIHFSNSPLNIKKYISISLASIVMGIIFLAGDNIVSFANSMTALLLALVSLEWCVAFEIYEIITNENHIHNLILDYFSISVRTKEMDFEEFQVHTDKSIAGLLACINENDLGGKDKACEMLVQLGEQIQKQKGKEGDSNYYKYFYIKLRGCMDSFAKVFGFNEMLNSVVKIYSLLSDFEYGRIDLYKIPLHNIRFWNDQMLLEKNYFKQISEMYLLDAYKNNQVTNSEVEQILYQYFESVMRNCICTKHVKDQLVKFYIAELTGLYWKTNEDGTEPDVNVLLNILKYYVLKNNDIEERNYVFKEIITQAFYNTYPYEKEKYFYFLSLFYQAFYAYAFCEVETLNEYYREGLQKTFEMEFSSESISKMSAASLLRINTEEILKAVGRRIKDEKESDLSRRFENFPSFSMAKTVVWTYEFNIDYLFMLYLIYYDEVGMYSIYSYFLEWDSITNENKLSFLMQLRKRFNEETGLLTVDFVNQYSQYGALLKHSCNIDEQTQRKLFEYINDELAELKIERINCQKLDLPEIDNRDVLSEIDEIMKREKIVGWNLGYSSEYYVKYTMPDFICRRECADTKNTAIIIQKGIIGGVQRYIRQCANKLILSFDMEGIRKLFALLDEKKYNARNYTFTNDWKLAKLKEETEFKTLESKQDSIELIKTPQLYQYIYFIKEDFFFNVKISKIEFIDLSEKECAEFLEQYKCYNGLYDVDGALLVKEAAMSCIKKLYCKRRCKFKLMISVNKDNMTYLEFEQERK